MPTSKPQVLAISGMGVYGKVANFASLPPANLHDGETWICLNSQGTRWLPGSLGGTYYPKGQYYSDGAVWLYDETAYQASQSDVNAGIITDQFVSPATLANTTVIPSGVQTALNNKIGTIQEEGVPLTQRATLNFIGPAVTATDDPINNRTDVTITATGGGGGPSSKLFNYYNFI